MTSGRQRLLEPGDIGATKAKGFWGWLMRNTMAPETDRYHFFILWREWGDDFLILESITSKGLALGKLSWYEGQDLTFYRVDCPAELRYTAPGTLVDYGRARYDYLLPIRLLGGMVAATLKILWKEHRLRKLRAEDLAPYYRWDRAMVCTEAVWAAFNGVGVNIIPYGVPPTPSAYEEARIEGRIKRLD